MPTWVAIDFGTTHTKLAYVPPGTDRPELLRFGPAQQPYTPSLFHLPDNRDSIEFGEPAAAALQNGATGVIPLIGRRLYDPKIRINTRVTTPAQLLEVLFKSLREAARWQLQALGASSPDSVVLCVPVNFDSYQVELITKAARGAGFERVETVEGPIAAARAWVAEGGGSEDPVVVLDHGGRAVDWTLLKFEAGKFRGVPSCPPGGLVGVGGQDIDLALCQGLRTQIDEAAFTPGASLQQKLLSEASRIKEAISNGVVPDTPRWNGARIHVSTPEILATLNKHFVTPVVEGLRGYLSKVKVSVGNGALPPVLLSGGGTKLPGLHAAIEKLGCVVVSWDRANIAPVLGALARARALGEAPRKRSPDTYPLALYGLSEQERKRIADETTRSIENLAAIANRQGLGEFRRKYLEQLPRISTGYLNTVLLAQVDSLTEDLKRHLQSQKSSPHGLDADLRRAEANRLALAELASEARKAVRSHAHS